MDLTVLDYTVIAFTGFFTGFINTIAAAGSLLTLPLLIFMGLPANEANATNRLAIFCQSIVGVLFFKQKNLLNIKSAMYLTIPCMLGSFVGAVIAIDLDEALLRKTIGIIMLIMMAVLFLKPEQWLKGKADKVQTSGFSVKEFTACFLIGVYGGFIQAGVGIFMLSMLVLICGYELKYANPIKIFMTLMLTIVALALFIYSGLVNYAVGLVLSAGSVLGAWAGSKATLKGGSPLIRRALLAVIFISAGELLGVWDWLIGLFKGA